MTDKKEILAALNQVMDPELNRSLVDLYMVRDLTLSDDGSVSFTLVLTVPECPLRERMASDARKALLALPGIKNVNITFGAMTEEERRAVLPQKGAALPKLNQFNHVKELIAVMSGKGGVGKSSITALLAVELTRQGKKVGILDADVTGPSIPRLFGLPPGGLRGSDMGILPAVTALGIRVMSANLMLQDENTPVIWRGPMITGLIQQFWNDVLWGKLDFLLVDLPPGTSDAALTVAQSLPLNGVLLVTTPQELAAMVVRKAVGMLQAMKIPIWGVVENMSYYRCPDTGKRHEIFGPSHADEIARAAGVQVSARLPIDPEIARLCDAGKVEEVHMVEIQALAETLLQQEQAKK